MRILPKDSLFPTFCTIPLGISHDDDDKVLALLFLSSDMVDCSDSSVVIESEAPCVKKVALTVSPNRIRLWNGLQIKIRQSTLPGIFKIKVYLSYLDVA